MLKMLSIKLSLLRLIGVLVLSVSWLLIFAVPVLAIDNPDSISVDTVYVYRHCLEDDDQLYVVEYTIEYSTLPDENVTTAYIGELKNGAVSLKTIRPYDSKWKKGYAEGVFAIYFTAAEVTAKGMVWEGAYTMYIRGDATLDWDPGPAPSDSTAAFDSWSTSTSIATTQNELSERILDAAATLEDAWDINMVDTYLTTNYGEPYFTNAIEGSPQMAPYAFTSSAVTPDWSKKSHAQTYAEDLADNASGTPLDVSTSATHFSLSTMWLSAGLYMVVIIVVLGNARHSTGRVGGAIPLLAIPLLIFGALVGIMPLIVVIVLGLGALVATGFALFYGPSGA